MHTVEWNAALIFLCVPESEESGIKLAAAVNLSGVDCVEEIPLGYTAFLERLKLWQNMRFYTQ